MKLVTLDFETFYDREYSLSKMTTEAYIRDPRFETIGVSIKVGGAPARWYSGDDTYIQSVLDSYELHKHAVLAHNTMFDGAILNWCYNIRPKFMFDTLSMARPLHAQTMSCALASLASYYGIGTKGQEVVVAMGLRRRDFTTARLAEYGAYCSNDVELTHKLFRIMGKDFPAVELRIIDQVLRMFTEPKLLFDRPVLEAYLAAELSRKASLVESMGLDCTEDEARSILMSNQKFAEWLRGRGVQPPRKISRATGRETYAFSKTDKSFTALLNHEDEQVAAAAAARLGVKSTLGETRAKMFMGIEERGAIPVMLNYYGAHCVPGDVEVLTRSGWERLDAWAGGDIMQWEPTGKLRFDAATKYAGPVITDWVRSTALYMPVDMTLGHNLAVRSHAPPKNHITYKAEELLTRRSAYITNAGRYTGCEIITPEQTRVLVMVQADGSYELNTSVGRRLAIFVKKPRKIQRARELLTAAGVPFTEQTYPSHPGFVRFVIRWRDLPDWLTPDRKLFGSWVMGCDTEAFTDELTHWDGYIHNGQAYYSTSDASNAEWVQTMVHLSGRGCSRSVHKGSGNRRDNYVLCIRERDYCMVVSKNVSLVQDSKQAFCATTKTGFWLARSKGHIFVTGNTGRMSGGDKANYQNLPRGGELRRAIVAPPGHVIVACDSSQIEARMLAWLAGQEDLLQAFREGRDIYSEFASTFFGRTITKADKLERHIGKTAILGLGYGMGVVRFVDTLASGAGGVKVAMLGDDAARLVRLYRTKYKRIPQFWNRCGDALAAMTSGQAMQLTDKLPSVVASGDTISLPNGMAIRYPLLTAFPNTDRAGNQYGYASDRRMHTKCVAASLTGSLEVDDMTRIYSGKVVENLDQALARIVVAEQSVRIAERYPVVLQVHDENVIVVPEDMAEEASVFMVNIMSTPPVWAPDLPVACEVNYGKSFYDCK